MFTVGVANEIAEYEANRAGDGRRADFVYPNGSGWDLRPAADTRSAVPHLLFMASGNAPWHGVDLLLDSLRETDQDFRLHLVGSMDKVTIERARKDNRVQLHGSLIMKDVHALMGQCVAGLSSFGLARNGMRQACPLKVRDYLAVGLPVIGGHEEVFPNDFPFYAKTEPNFSQILEITQRFAGVSRQEVARTAIPLISKKEILRKFYNQLSLLSAEAGGFIIPL